MTLEEKVLNILNDCDGSNWDSSGEYYECFEKSTALELIKKLILTEVEDAFDAGYDYRSSLLPEIISEFGENSIPNKEQYLNQLK